MLPVKLSCHGLTYTSFTANLQSPIGILCRIATQDMPPIGQKVWAERIDVRQRGPNADGD